MLFLKVFWKEYLALFRPPELEKKKQKAKTKTKHKYGSAVRMKIIILRAVVQSWNFADFDLYIDSGTVAFPHCKTIKMPLIF